MANTVRTEYKNNWQREHLDRINLTVPKGQKETIQAHAAAHDESVTAFVNRAIHEAIERDLMLGPDKEKIIDCIKAYLGNIDEQEIKKLVEALTILESQAPGMTDIFLAEIKPPEPSKLTVICF